MRYNYEEPTTDKAGLRNKVRMILNALNENKKRQAEYHAQDLLDDLLPERVVFSWGVNRAQVTEELREGIAAFGQECPGMVD